MYHDKDQTEVSLYSGTYIGDSSGVFPAKGAEFTLVVWLKRNGAAPDVDPGYTVTEISAGTDISWVPDTFLAVCGWKGDSYEFGHQNYGAGTTVDSALAPVEDRWRKYVWVSRNTPAMDLFCDGVKNSVSDTNTKSTNPAYDWNFHAGNGSVPTGDKGGFTKSGQIFFYDRALTEAEAILESSNVNFEPVVKEGLLTIFVPYGAPGGKIYPYWNRNGNINGNSLAIGATYAKDNEIYPPIPSLEIDPRFIQPYASLAGYIYETLALAGSAAVALAYDYIPQVVKVRAVGAYTAVSGTTRTPVLPTHATNDILLMFSMSRGTSATLTCATSGWTGLTQVNNGTNLRTRIFWKRAASSSETNPTVTSSVTEHLSAYCISVQGAVTSGSPFDATETSGTGSSTTMTAPDITVATAYALLIRAYMSSDDNNHGSPSEGTLLAGGTSYHSTAGTDGAQSSSRTYEPTTGAAGTATMTQGSNGPDNFVAYSVLLKPQPSGTTYNETLTLAGAAAITEAFLHTLVGSATLSAIASQSQSNIANLYRALTLDGSAATGVLGTIIMNATSALNAGAAIGEAGGVNFDESLGLSAQVAQAQAAIKVYEAVLALSAGASVNTATAIIANELVNLTALANFTPAQIAQLLAQVSLAAGAAMAYAEEVIPPAGIYYETIALAGNAGVTANVQAILNVLVGLTAQGAHSPASIQTHQKALELAAQAGFTPNAIGVFNHIASLAAAAGYVPEGSIFTGVFLELLKDLVTSSAAKAIILTKAKESNEAASREGLISPSEDTPETDLPKDLLTPYE